MTAQDFHGDELRRLQRERGICSCPDCDQPILGWCDTCDRTRGPRHAPKLCERHLMAHCTPRGHTPYQPYLPAEEGGDAPPF